MAATTAVYYEAIAHCLFPTLNSDSYFSHIAVSASGPCCDSGMQTALGVILQSLPLYLTAHPLHHNITLCAHLKSSTSCVYNVATK